MATTLIQSLPDRANSGGVEGADAIPLGTGVEGLERTSVDALKAYILAGIHQGVDGTNGATILSGDVPPPPELGVDGDFYLNLATGDIYGPKAGGAWGAATSLKGAPGRDAFDYALNFVADGSIYIPADEAMTLNLGSAPVIGTGVLAYAKSTAAAPDTFTDSVLPITLEAGAWLRVRASGVVDHLAAHLERTA